MCAVRALDAADRRVPRHCAAKTPAAAATTIAATNERFERWLSFTAEGRDDRVAGTLLATRSGIAARAASITTGGTRGVGISEGC